MLYWLRTLALAPLLLAQGMRVRRRALILPEPPGNRAGQTGNGPELSLLIAGDSAAAGVGARHQNEALLGQTLASLCPHFSVRWRLEAVSGATTGATLKRLQGIEPARFCVAITSLGVNDVTSGAGLGSWLKQQVALRELLRERHHARLIVVSGLPPVHLFPALPQPLRWHLGLRARQFDRALRAAVAAEPDCVFISLDVSGSTDDMARDGFHPGPEIYRRWGSASAERILQWRGIA